MRNAMLGLCQPLGKPCSVRALPKDAEIAFAVRLESDSLTVGRPHGIAIGASKCEPSHGACACEIVYRDDVVIQGLNCDSFAVRRNSWHGIHSWRKAKRFSGSIPLNQRERISSTDIRRCRSRDVNKRSGVGNAELCGCRTPSSQSPDTFDYHHGPTRNFQLL